MKRKMWKRIAACFGCLALLASVAGCAVAPDTTAPTGNASDTTSCEATGTTPPAEDMRYDPSTWPKLQPYSQKPVMEADPEREVYISLKNQNCDFYPGVVYNGAAFDIITKSYFQPEEIQVHFPGETKCEIRVAERNEEFQNIAFNQGTNGYNMDGQQPYHYLCLQGVDLQTLGQQSSDARYAAEAYSSLVQNNQAEGNDYTALIEKYVDPYNALYQGYMDAYTNQNSQKVTDYNAYTVNLIFDQQKYAGETVEYIDVVIGDSTYHVEFGQWRFHTEPCEGIGETNKGVNLGTIAILGASGDSPYAEGYMKLSEAIRFSAKDEILLTGLRCADGTPAEILGAQVASTSAGSSIDYYWNGRDSVKVDNGSSVVMSVYLYSDSFQEYEMSMTSVLYVDYVLSSTGAEYTMAIPCKIARYNKLWDTYCLAFLGVDVGEYYHYFSGEVMELYWIDEIPESWRKA